MPDYKAMHYALLSAHCDVIDILQRAAQQAEETAITERDIVHLQNLENKEQQ